MVDRKSWQQHAGPVVQSAEEFDVIDCEACGFKHVVPIPTAEQLEEIYRENYFSQDKPLYFQENQEDQEWWQLSFRDRFESFEAILGRKSGRILDIGAGSGHFLTFGKQRGWQTLGLEPSRAATEFCREQGLEIVEGLLDEQTVAQLGQFDVVHMRNVLEHLPDPAATLELVKNLLSPGGLLCASAPNDFNPLQQTLQQECDYRPWWVLPPHHLNYFDFKSLQALLERKGFEICERETSFPMEMFLLMGDNYTDNPELGRECHNKRKRFELLFDRLDGGEKRRDFSRALAAAGLGREVVLIGRLQ